MADFQSSDKILEAFGALMLVPIILFVAIIFGTLTGAISGWTVGLFFGDTILSVLGQFGIHGITMWQFGAFLGFVGGFFKTSYYQKSK